MKVVQVRGMVSTPGGLRCFSGFVRAGFAGPPDNPDELNQKMSDIVSQLRSAYQSGHDKIVASHGTGFWDTVTGAGDTYAEDLATYEKLPAFIDQLDGDLRQAVLSGENMSGNPYTFSQWVTQAKSIVADAITRMTGNTVDASGWNIVAGAARQTAHDLNPLNADSPLSPKNWPWWAWAGAAGLALVAAGPVINLAAAVIGKRRSPSPA